MINPTTHAITEFPIPTAGSGPTAITAGPDGNLWFTETGANQIGMINPTTHAITEFPIPTAGSEPDGITAGPDGNLWFTEDGANQIGMINPTTHAITEFPIPTAGSGPDGITTGPDGNLWFTEDRRQQDRDDQPDDARHRRVPHPHGRQRARRDHDRARRQSLVHRGPVATRSG